MQRLDMRQAVCTLFAHVLSLYHSSVMQRPPLCDTLQVLFEVETHGGSVGLPYQFLTNGDTLPYFVLAAKTENCVPTQLLFLLNAVSCTVFPPLYLHRPQDHKRVYKLLIPFQIPITIPLRNVSSSTTSAVDVAALYQLRLIPCLLGIGWRLAQLGIFGRFLSLLVGLLRVHFTP